MITHQFAYNFDQFGRPIGPNDELLDPSQTPKNAQGNFIN